jgi:alkanesulfonate monooxygenase SsuD/methylene tetrahydromethanopterin reductase-like flavin-dependent oxidoreductase (luciferase family)
MTEIGLFLSSEEHGPKAVVEFARLAEEAGLRPVLISDHYHPWIDDQGQSPFLSGVIGAISRCTDLKVTSCT